MVNFVEQQQEKAFRKRDDYRFNHKSKRYDSIYTRQNMNQIVSDTIIATCEEIKDSLYLESARYACKRLINQAKESK